MDNLAVDCYGGTTFQYDNYVVPDIVQSQVSLHGGQYSVQLPVKDLPPRKLPPMAEQILPPRPLPTKPDTFQNDPAGPQCPSLASPTSTPPTSACSVVMKQAKSLLPSGNYAIALPQSSQDCPVLVYPPTPSPSSLPLVLTKGITLKSVERARNARSTDSPVFRFGPFFF